jgi:ribosomal protein S18 acetylase RimI-like enzyme
MRMEPDTWLKSIFGYDVFRVVDFRQERHNLHELNSKIQSLHKAFIFTKIPVEQQNILFAGLQLGFRIADINVTLERKPESLKRPEGSQCNVRIAFPKECQDVSDIAGVCFSRSRFHQDPNIPKNVADMIKRKWVQNYFKGERGECILVAEVSGRPVGFLAIAKAREKDQTIRIIDLIGVHMDYQGRGIGNQMVNYFISDSISHCDTLRVGTQIINLPSLHLYEKKGFCITDSAYVLHAHVQDGKVIP